MKPTHLLGYLVAGGVIFSAGYAFGSGADTIASLRKQPASMLTLGVLGANSALQDGRLTVESGKFVVSKTVMTKSGGCEAELDALRKSLGVEYDKNGVKISPSNTSKYFIPAEEQNSNDAGVLARRDAIDEATVVRIKMQVGSCEGPLLKK
ncbi:MAG: hypothetical protein JNL21_28570 [Myxococcales bacterium]|nr:hypothetical protein [Myxococcales bacterium]